MYRYYITAAGNSISLQLGSSCQGNRYGTENSVSMAHPPRTKSHLPVHSPPVSQAGRRVGPSLKPLASFAIAVKRLSYLSRVLVLEYPIQAFSAGHENTNKQRRPNQTTGGLLHYPVKASGDLKKDNCLLQPYSAGSIENCLCKNPTMQWSL